MMDDITKRRVDQAVHSNDVRPIDMLRHMIHLIEEEGATFNHLVIAWHDDNERFGYFQAGKFRCLDGVGLIECVKDMMMRDSRCGH